MSIYNKLGVSANKEDVHNAIANLDAGLYPNAFCKVLPDLAANQEDFVNIIHTDTAGTKSILAYLYWLETKNKTIWKNLAQDALVMNTDDMSCAGVTNNFITSSNIARNKNVIDGEILSEIIAAPLLFSNILKEYGINLTLAGGETADVGDVVRTLDVGYTMFGRIPKAEIVDIDIKDGMSLVVLASFGKAIYEDEYNSGIGCNGLTLARHSVLDSTYSLFTETYDPSLPKEHLYSGKFKLTDMYEGYQVGNLLLSPTRTYLPIVKEVLSKYRNNIGGIIHTTGGGASKVKKFIKNLTIVKNNLFDAPPVFKMIKESGNIPLEEMYQVFNMGQRLEIYCDKEIAEKIIEISKKYEVYAQIGGYCMASEDSKVIIEKDGETIIF